MVNQILQMTWQNPIFMMVLIGALWFVPGIIVRRIAEDKIKKEKIKIQDKKISRLYPKDLEKDLE